MKIANIEQVSDLRDHQHVNDERSRRRQVLARLLALEKDEQDKHREQGRNEQYPPQKERRKQRPCAGARGRSIMAGSVDRLGLPANTAPQAGQRGKK
jgi:hypothetical protein